MRNRSNNPLPAFYTYHNDMITDAGKPIVAPLEINDFTYLHFHDCIEIGYCVSGTGVCMVEDRQYTFQQGDVQIVFPYQKHLSRNNADASARWCWFTFHPHLLMEKSGFASSGKIEQLIFHEMGLCGIFSPEQYPEIVALVKQLFRELLEQDDDSPYHLELGALYVYQLLICLARLSETLPKLHIERDGNLQSVATALEFIAQAVANASVPSVEMLAASCSMSVSNFRRVFRKIVGLSPKDYITKCFINKAQQLLLTTHKSILEICAETGFGDVSWFNRQFLAKTNMTPSAFRRKYSKFTTKVT